jgi:hypothetical protein
MNDSDVKGMCKKLSIIATVTEMDKHIEWVRHVAGLQSQLEIAMSV